MAKRAPEQGEDQIEPETAVTHPEEIRLEAELTIRGRPAAPAAIRTTPGVICAGLAVAAIILSAGAVVK